MLDCLYSEHENKWIKTGSKAGLSKKIAVSGPKCMLKFWNSLEHGWPRQPPASTRSPRLCGEYEVATRRVQAQRMRMDESVNSGSQPVVLHTLSSPRRQQQQQQQQQLLDMSARDDQRCPVTDLTVIDFCQAASTLVAVITPELDVVLLYLHYALHVHISSACF